MDSENSRKLKDMANVMRRDVLKMTTAAGSGHPTSCMSMAEIMSVLFFEEMSYDVKDALNPDNDEFVLSKGHSAPILYSALKRAGCINEDLMNLRKLGSNLEGHPMPRDLEWIKVATGSLGQGLSVGVGMALAGKLQKRKFRTFVLLGDSEMSEGSNYEALQLGAYYNLDNLIAIVDINRLGQRGETISGHDVNEYKKKFEGFGWEVISIDGHSISQISKAFSNAKKSNKPTLILAKTYKGKGVSFLENKEGWHGKAVPEDKLEKALSEVPNPEVPQITIKKPKKLKTRVKERHNKINLTNYKKGDESATRDGYGEALSKIAGANSDVIVTDGEVSNSTRAGKVKEENQNQFIEGFIAEQNMVGMALGLSKKGFNVFASSFSAFLSRAHDQIRMTALSNPKKLTFCGSHAGVSIGEDGASQMGLEDIAMFRDLPNSIVFYPSDAVSAEKLTKLAFEISGLKYIRTTRPKTPVIYNNSEEFKIGDFKVLEKSNKDKAVLVGAGVTVHEALKACEELKEEKKNVAVIDLYCIKPFNSKKFIDFVKKHGKKVVVAEDHYKAGGIGEMLAGELVNSEIKMKHLYVDKIPHSGEKDELLDRQEINSKAIVEAVKKF